MSRSCDLRPLDSDLLVLWLAFIFFRTSMIWRSFRLDLHDFHCLICMAFIAWSLDLNLRPLLQTGNLSLQHLVVLWPSASASDGHLQMERLQGRHLSVLFVKSSSINILFAKLSSTRTLCKAVIYQYTFVKPTSTSVHARSTSISTFCKANIY